MSESPIGPLAPYLRQMGYGTGTGGYSPAPGSPGSSWAAAIQASTPTGATATGATMNPNDPLLAPIYMGSATGSADPTPQGYGSSGSNTTTQTSTIDALLTEFERMKKAEQRRLALLLTIGGYAGSVALKDAPGAASDLTYNEVLDAYNELLMDAAGRYQRGQNITPQQLLEQNVAYRLPKNSDWDGSYGDLVGVLHQNDIDVQPVTESEDQSGTFTTTSTNTSVNRDVMDPNDAMALTRAMLQRELGRDPTKGEFEDFIGAVQAAQRANPSRTTTTSKNTVTTDKDGRVVDSDTSSTSNTQAGISQAGIEDLMLRRARRNPDWAEWQAVGTYAPALFSALGATVPGV